MAISFGVHTLTRRNRSHEAVVRFPRAGVTPRRRPPHFVGALLRPATLTTRGRLSASGALRALVGLAKRAARFTPALVGHGVCTALGFHCRGADCASRSSILPTAVPVRGVGAGEPDRHIVHALVGCRGPAATGRHRGCGAESRVRALRRYRVGVHCPARVAGLRGRGTAAVV